MGTLDRCPICKSDFKTCPHSIRQVDAYKADDKIRKLIRQEVAKYLRKDKL